MEKNEGKTILFFKKNPYNKLIEGILKAKKTKDYACACIA
jgi:hypothetical protein